jgi:hypothetical protein
VKAKHNIVFRDTKRHKLCRNVVFRAIPLHPDLAVFDIEM